MGKIRNLCMTQLVRMKKIKEPDMYTWIFSSVDNCYYNYNSRYLFEYVKEEARKMNCYEVTLNVWAGNTSAEKFYEKMGMKTKERQMEYILEH